MTIAQRAPAHSSGAFAIDLSGGSVPTKTPSFSTSLPDPSGWLPATLRVAGSQSSTGPHTGRPQRRPPSRAQASSSSAKALAARESGSAPIRSSWGVPSGATSARIAKRGCISLQPTRCRSDTTLAAGNRRGHPERSHPEAPTNEALARRVLDPALALLRRLLDHALQRAPAGREVRAGGRH